MTATAAHQPAAARIATGTAWCAVVALGVGAWSAATVVVCGAQAPLRSFLHFGFDGVSQTPGQAVAIAAHNAALAAAPLIAAAIAQRLQAIQVGVEILLGALLIANSALIGLALGAYGARLAGALAIHLPLELAAFCLAGGTYLAAIAQPLRHRTLGASAAGCVVLLAVAAVAETYLPPGTL